MAIREGERAASKWASPSVGRKFHLTSLRARGRLYALPADETRHLVRRGRGAHLLMPDGLSLC